LPLWESPLLDSGVSSTFSLSLIACIGFWMEIANG
jgi:hypothetical protein